MSAHDLYRDTREKHGTKLDVDLLYLNVSGLTDQTLWQKKNEYNFYQQMQSLK